MKYTAAKEGIGWKLVAAASVVDVPLSVIGDTFTLPLTVYATVSRVLTTKAPIDPDAASAARHYHGDPPSQAPPERIHGNIIE
jgi:hypothetical protein